MLVIMLTVLLFAKRGRPDAFGPTPQPPEHTTPFCATVRVPVPPPATPPHRDALDVPFQELATVGGADFFVTGDIEALTLYGVFPCPIVNANQFSEKLSGS